LIAGALGDLSDQSSLKFDQAVHHIVLEDCIAAIGAVTARRE